MLADDVWQLWRTVASEHGSDIRLGVSASQTQHLMALADAYQPDELGRAMRAWWDSPWITGRNLGLFVSQVDEVLAHLAKPDGRAFRQPAPKPSDTPPPVTPEQWTPTPFKRRGVS